MLVFCMQMASKAGKDYLPRPTAKPQQDVFSFSPPSRHTDKLPHSSNAAGNVQRERDATAAAQLSQLCFAEQMPGANLQQAPAGNIAGLDGGACRCDSSDSPGDGLVQYTAGARKEVRQAASHTNALQAQNADLQAPLHKSKHQETGHSAAKPGQGSSVNGSASEAREKPSAREAVGQQPVFPTSSRSDNMEGSAPASRQWRASLDSGLQPGPVFVPIVLTMDDADHEHLVEEWVLRQTVSVPGQPSSWQGMRGLQGHHKTDMAIFGYIAISAEEKQQG